MKLKFFVCLLFLIYFFVVSYAQASPPSTQEIYSHVSTYWKKKQFNDLEKYIINLYEKNKNYVPAIVAKSFYDYVYKGNLIDAVKQLQSVNNVIVSKTEFKVFLEQEIRDILEEIQMHKRMGTTDDELAQNASPEVVRNEWGDIEIPLLKILKMSPELNIN